MPLEFLLKKARELRVKGCKDSEISKMLEKYNTTADQADKIFLKLQEEARRQQDDDNN